ncbi:CPBP family intramembrane glutamic endopeptidase [Micromonospora sp. WMMD1082]|uniref:CPBP family intramembrane glutamic endopeptidase n=1 Tax=Micromonospora sp. WMMD1082 TaxID=3016104 RepID=UPI0024166829|nr:CPBP family intramembrane glutamic endopeptidase [Micromonospora sp. WMMD1082]MDG4796087.1 CPBP family intramembrane metalloprotease [Micromonospora sp. WMMD1082]
MGDHDPETGGAQPMVRPTETARWVIPVLIPLAAVFVAYALLVPDGPAEAARSVAVAVAWGSTLVLALVVTVLVVLGGMAVRRGPGGGRRRPGSLRTWLAVAVVGYLILLTAVSGRMAPLPVFDPLEHHWQGKVLDLIWLAILFGLLRRWARTEVGLRVTIAAGSARPAAITIISVFGFFVGLTVLAVVLDPSTVAPVSAERIAYDATIPNLTEELIWRGAMLAVLDRAFGTPRVVLGAPVGWGIVITSVVFGVGHGVLIDLAGGWSVNLAGGVFATVMGLALGWIWARTGSVWPAFLLHCAPELGVDVGMLMTG